MMTIEPEHEKYFKKFGRTGGSSIDWQKESRKPLARCSICVMKYDGAHPSDNLILETRNGRMFLCCPAHRRKKYAE